MASTVGIVNLGLRAVGASRITNLTEGSRNANVANDIFDDELEALLQIHDWNFAKAEIKLARNSTAPVAGFKYSYAYPSDYLETREVHDNDQKDGSVDYGLADDGLHSAAEDIYLTYTRRIVDPNVMPPAFRMTLSFSLAVIFAIRIAKSRGLSTDMETKARFWLNKAQTADSQADMPDEMPEGSWVEDRSL